MDDGRICRGQSGPTTPRRRWFEGSITAARGVFIGTWLGLLDRTSLYATNETVLPTHAHVPRRALQSSRDSSAGRRGSFERHFLGCRSVLVSSAGGGRDSRCAGATRPRRGPCVRVPPRSRFKVPTSILGREGSRARRPRPAGRMPTPIFQHATGRSLGGRSYTLMQHASTRIRFLKQLRPHLPNGAPVLVSVFARQQAIRYLRIVTRTANVLRAIRGRKRRSLATIWSPTSRTISPRTSSRPSWKPAGFDSPSFQA